MNTNGGVSIPKQADVLDPRWWSDEINAHLTSYDKEICPKDFD
jgi:hypothetical protein